MKRNILILSLLTAAVGITSFGVINQTGADQPAMCEPSSSIPTDEVTISLPGLLPAIQEEAEPELFYHVQGWYGRSITKEKLITAHSLSDIISHYPVNWIGDYRGVKISGSCNQAILTAHSPDAVLSTEQKSLLKTIDYGSNLLIKVDYSTQERATDRWEEHQMNVTMTVIPEKEAEFPGGQDELNNYLRNHSQSNVIGKAFDPLQPGFILFTITEEGEIEDVTLGKTSGDDELDTLSLELIKAMPNWNPAINYNGVPVRQLFELRFGQPGC